MTELNLMTAVIGEIICNKPNQILNGLSSEDIDKLFKFAARQDLAHLAGYVLLGKTGYSDEQKKTFKMYADSAIYRYLIRESAVSEIEILLPLIVIFLKSEQLLNAKLSIFVTEYGRVIFFNKV